MDNQRSRPKKSKCGYCFRSVFALPRHLREYHRFTAKVSAREAKILRKKEGSAPNQGDYFIKVSTIIVYNEHIVAPTNLNIVDVWYRLKCQVNPVLNISRD